jgi:acyl carrier protein
LEVRFSAPAFGGLQLPRETIKKEEVMQYMEEVKDILAEILSLGDRRNSVDENSALLGSIPELDSMAVINLITALEEHFGIAVDDDEISATTFATLGSLTQFVNQKLAV